MRNVLENTLSWGRLQAADCKAMRHFSTSPLSHPGFVLIKAGIGKTFEIHSVSVKRMFSFVQHYLKAEINL